MIVDPSRPDPVVVDPSLRPGLRQVTRVLIGYGIAGLAVAAIGLLALLVGLGRLNGLADQLRDDGGGVSDVLERTATALDGASATATGFGTTIDTSTTALGRAAADLREVGPRLRDLETQANGIDVLGSRPLAPLGGLFGQIAGQLADLDGQLDAVAAGLGTNRTALTANAASLADLATETRALADRLGGDALPGAIDDARWLLVAMLLVGALGAAVPATGALIVGLWLRRWLTRTAQTADG